MSKNRRIVIEGSDGTGKTTIVNLLRGAGFTNVHDRGEISRWTLNQSVELDPDTTYIVLVATPETSLKRLQERGANMTEEYHTLESLRYFYDLFSYHSVLMKCQNVHFVEADFDLPHVLIGVLNCLKDFQFKIGMPSGRLADKFPNIYYFKNPSAGRELSYSVKNVTLIWTRTKLYPDMLAFGSLDFAFMGSDVFESTTHHLDCSTFSLRQNASIYLMSPDGTVPENRPLRVATPFPHLISMILMAVKIPHICYEVNGSSEVFPSLGLADVVFDIVESGETMKAHGLQIVQDGPVIPLSLVLVHRKPINV